MIINTKALVIKEHTFGESDKFITLFTKEIGKIQVVAPQAKKSDKGLASGTQLFVYGDFMLLGHNGTYKLLNVDIIHMFHHLREDLFALSYGAYVAEFLREVLDEGITSNELMRLSLKTLQKLEHFPPSYDLIRRIFEVRALSIIGFMPNVWECVDCLAPVKPHEERYVFIVDEGGLICNECKGHYTYSPKIMISYSLLYTLQYILSAPLDQLYAFNLDSVTLKELGKLCDKYRGYYLDKHLKTIDFIESIQV